MSKSKLIFSVNKCFFLILFLLAGANGQDDFRAQIINIAFSENGEKTEIEDSTDRVVYQHHNKPGWINAKPDANLYDKDKVLIHRLTYARLELQSSSVEATFTLWGDSSIISFPAAAYEIQNDPVKLGYWDLFVTYGSFVASKLRGVITSRSKAMTVIPRNTRYHMRVEKESQRTFVFVEEGEVEVIAGGKTLLLHSFEAAQALPGGVPLKVNLSTVSVDRYSNLVEYHDYELWNRGILAALEKPMLYILTAAGGVVGVLLASPSSKPKKNKAKGTISVTW